jgi:hypothetical protein
MSSILNLKYFVYGCVSGLFLQLYFSAQAEKRYETSREEMNKLKLLYENQIDNLKTSSRKDQHIVFSFLYHTYMEFAISTGFLILNFINQENKTDKIKSFLMRNLESINK